MRELFWRTFERYGELIGLAGIVPFLVLSVFRSLIKENWLVAATLAAILGVLLFELPAMWRKARQKWTATEEWGFKEYLKQCGFASVLFVLAVLSIPLYFLWLAMSALF
jgi:hypothetical protein